MQCKRTWWRRASVNIADHTIEALIVTRRCREIATCPTHTKPLSRQDGDVWAWTVRSTNQSALRAHTVGPRFEFAPGTLEDRCMSKVPTV